MLGPMQSTSVRIDKTTHRELIRLASELGTTLGDTVALVTRRFRQGQMAEQLAVPLTPDESAWLDADLG